MAENAAGLRGVNIGGNTISSGCLGESSKSQFAEGGLRKPAARGFLPGEGTPSRS